MKKILLYSALAGLAFVSAQSWAMEPHETTPEPSTQGHNYSFVKAFGLNNSFAGVTLGLISFENWQADVLSRESFPLAVQKEVELDDRSLSDDEKQKAAIENLLLDQMVADTENFKRLASDQAPIALEEIRPLRIKQFEEILKHKAHKEVRAACLEEIRKRRKNKK